MQHPRVRVEPSEFAKFLRDSRDVATSWKVDTNEQFAEVSFGGSYTVDELMAKLEQRLLYSYSEELFVVHPDEDVQDVRRRADEDDARDGDNEYENVPVAIATDLSQYTIRRRGMGSDWLKFACTLEAADHESCLTLLPAESEDDDPDE